MALSVKHGFECLIPDDPALKAAGNVMQQEHWGAEHALTVSEAGLLGATAAGPVVGLTPVQARTVLSLGTAALAATGDFDAAGQAAAALASALAASAQRAANLSDLANATTARTNLGLGTAATHAHNDYAVSLAPTDIKTANYAAVAGEFVPVSTALGNVTITLPTAPADRSRIGVKQAIRGGANTVTIATGGADVFNRAGGSTQITLTVTDESALVQYQLSTGIWYVTADDLPYATFGTAAFTAASAYDVAGAAAAAQAASQPLDADLTAIAALASAADKVPYATGAQAWALADFTAAGRAIVGAANAAAQIAVLGLGSLATLSAAPAGTLTGTTLAANVVTTSITSAAVGTLGTAAILASDTDATLAANSDARLATQKAVKGYVDSAVTGLLDFKGSTDASGNPNYAAASKGDSYFISVAGKIGGASGKSVEVGDLVVASADNAGGTEASVGTSWFVMEHNLVGAVIAGGALGTPSSGVATNLTGTAAGLTAGSATVLVTPRAIYGNNFDGSAALTQIIASTFGGTGNGFTKFSGPTTSEKTFTLPDASATLMTTTTAVLAAQMPALTGDITTGAGAVATTLATVNSNVGAFTNASITVNAKGLITAASSGAAAGDMVLASVQTVTGAKTFGTIGGAVGKLILAGSTSGSSTLDAAAVAGSTAFVLPAVSGTLAILGANTFTGDQTINSAGLIFSGNISAAAWTTNGLRVKAQAATFTDTTSSGTVAAAYTNVYGGNTIAATNATTFSDYYTTFISAPLAGTNVTLTRKWALGLNAGLSIAQGTANATALAITGGSITGSATTVPGITVAGTANTSAVIVGALLYGNLTATAVGAGSTLIDVGTGGGSYASKFKVDTTGIVVAAGTITSGSGGVLIPGTGSGTLTLKAPVTGGQTGVPLLLDLDNVATAANTYIGRNNTLSLTVYQTGAGTTAFAEFRTYGDTVATGIARLATLGGSFTTSGLWVANLNILSGAGTDLLVNTETTAKAVIIASGGHTAASEVARFLVAGLTVKAGVPLLVPDSNGSYIQTPGMTVANLPGTPVRGMRAYVTDSNATSYTLGIGAVVAGGGAVILPVFYDGTNWRIG